MVECKQFQIESVKRKMWTPEENRIFAEAHAELGDQWDEISKLFERWGAKDIRTKWNSETFKARKKAKTGNRD